MYSSASQCFECQIEFKHIDSRFTEPAPLALAGVLDYQPIDEIEFQAAQARDAWRLVVGGGQTDIRVESAGRRSHQIERWRAVLRGIGTLQCGYARFHTIDEGGIEWTQIGATRSHAIVRPATRGDSAGPGSSAN